MVDESVVISAKTRTRNLDPISKDGYSDGIIDGQKASFQSSFDLGYGQGLLFGLEIGLRGSQKTKLTEQLRLNYPRGINCQVCLNNVTGGENIFNLYNMQREQNNSYLKTST